MHSSRFRKSALGLIALACLGGASVNAETITFATSGVFTNTDYSGNYGSSVNKPLLAVAPPNSPTNGSATLTFNGFSNATPGSVAVDDAEESNISFGEFTLTLVAPVPSVNASATMNYGFKLTVNQLTPAGATSDPSIPVFAGQIAGNVNFTYNPTTGSGSSTSLTLNFPKNGINPQSVTFYTQNTAVTYYVDNIRLAAPKTNNGVTTVQGYLEFSRTGQGTPVPTPAAIWSGCGLLGVLGAARLRKRSVSQD